MSDEQVDAQRVSALVESLSLGPLPSKWLMDLWHSIQALDDWADGASLKRGRIERVIFCALYELPANPWAMQYAADLYPLVGSAVLKWVGANAIEGAAGSDEHMLRRAYMWRAGYWDIVLSVVAIVHGPQVAMANAGRIASFYGESWEEYRAGLEQPPQPLRVIESPKE